MVEKWLLQVEEVMISSVKKIIGDSVGSYRGTPRERWVLDWPGQVVICVSSIFWTMEVEEAFGIENGVTAYLEKCNGQIDQIVELVRGPLSAGERITLGALTVIDVHGEFLCFSVYRCAK